MVKRWVLVLALIVLVSSFVEAAHVITTSSGAASFSVNESVVYQYNISVNNSDVNVNISSINITLPSGFVFIAGGGSKTIQLVLLPNDDVSGTQSFTIKVNNISKQVSVEFPKKSIFGGLFGNNQLAWIIGLVNVILIILIIIVAIRVSRN